jgi:hypothetical protein
MKISAAFCAGFIPTPSSVIIALVDGSTLNSSAANRSTAVNGASSGTLRLDWRENGFNAINLDSYTLYGNFGSLVNVILNVTFPPPADDGAEAGAEDVAILD